MHLPLLQRPPLAWLPIDIAEDPVPIVPLRAPLLGPRLRHDVNAARALLLLLSPCSDYCFSRRYELVSLRTTMVFESDCMQLRLEKRQRINAPPRMAESSSSMEVLLRKIHEDLEDS